MTFSSLDKLYKLHTWLDRRAGKLSLALGVSLLAKSTYTHIFPKSFCLAKFGSVTINSEETGEAIKLIHETCVEVGIKPKSIIPFVVEGDEVKSAGFFALGTRHSVLGVPRTFQCTYSYEIINLDVFRKIRRNCLGTSTDTQRLGKPTENEIQLANAFVLSEKAKKFIIVKHLKRMKENLTLFEAAISPIFVALGYTTYKHFPKVLPMQKNRSFLIVAIVGSWIMCKFSEYMFQYYIDDYLDNSVSCISKEYAEGGQECYQSLANGNKTLRILLGRRGELLYKENGDLAGRARFFANGLVPSKKIAKFKKLNN